MANTIFEGLAMMDQQEGFQPTLFYHQINLEQRVPKDHLLRTIREKIDFDFIYGKTIGDTSPFKKTGVIHQKLTCPKA